MKVIAITGLVLVLMVGYASCAAEAWRCRDSCGVGWFGIYARHGFELAPRCVCVKERVVQ